jgi:hypothetical protein
VAAPAAGATPSSVSAARAAHPAVFLIRSFPEVVLAAPGPARDGDGSLTEIARRPAVAAAASG